MERRTKSGSKQGFSLLGKDVIKLFKSEIYSLSNKQN